jgi:hypothetical protein
MNAHVLAWYEYRRTARCPECGTMGYLVLASRGKCQICLGIRLAKLAALS